MVSFWDERYREEQSAYGEEPNAFLKTFLAQRPAGKILFPSEGQGRNAVYAAEIGWQVDAFDFSASGRDTALALAERKQVEIHYDLADVATVLLPENEYDVVALIYAHLPEALRQRLHRSVTAALKPGGTTVLEAFNKAQLPNTSGGPKDPSMLYSSQELQDDFCDLHIVSLAEVETILDEGQYHSGQANVIRLIAEKPMGEAS